MSAYNPADYPNLDLTKADVLDRISKIVKSLVLCYNEGHPRLTDPQKVENATQRGIKAVLKQGLPMVIVLFKDDDNDKVKNQVKQEQDKEKEEKNLADIFPSLGLKD